MPVPGSPFVPPRQRAAWQQLSTLASAGLPHLRELQALPTLAPLGLLSAPLNPSGHVLDLPEPQALWLIDIGAAKASQPQNDQADPTQRPRQEFR